MPNTSTNKAAKATPCVLLLEKLHVCANEHFERAGVKVVRVDRALNEQELINELERTKCIAIGIRSKTKLTRRVLETANHSLIAVGCFCIGVNQVDTDCAAEQGIAVFNSPFSNSRSVAEMMIAQIVNLARKIGDCNRRLHQGVWQKSSAGCHEVRGKVLGIVGYGHIGSQLSVLAESMGMVVLFYDIIKKLPLGNSSAVLSLKELLMKADFVSLHVPDTPETRNMIGRNELAAMKQGSYLLNASRGTVVVLEDLAAALKSGHLSGAAVDVYPSEPSQSKCTDWLCVLQECPNTILTPHIGGSTEEAQETIGHEVADLLVRYVNDGISAGSVNFPQVQMQRAADDVRRICVVHRNQPGVMRNVNDVLRDYNIVAESLATRDRTGYLTADVDAASDEQVSDILHDLEALQNVTIVRAL